MNRCGPLGSAIGVLLAGRFSTGSRVGLGEAVAVAVAVELAVGRGVGLAVTVEVEVGTGVSFNSRPDWQPLASAAQVRPRLKYSQRLRSRQITARLCKLGYLVNVGAYTWPGSILM